MDTIRNYLESLFIEVPRNRETEKLKTDLLANMEDHYHELIEEGKNEHEAIGTVIATFGSIDELLDEMNLEKEKVFAETDGEKNISLEEAEEYWRQAKKTSFQIASGVFISCLAIAGFFFFAGLGGLSIAFGLLFLGAAVAVGFFIVAGMKNSELNRFLGNRLISGKVIHAAQLREDAYRKSFSFSLIGGIGLCVFSLFPILASMTMYAGGTIGISGFFITVGAGVFLLIYGSCVRHSYRRFTQNNYSW
ncbi:permease prefix domain 1-containing protein [Enterococcus songbeiensis]